MSVQDDNGGEASQRGGIATDPLDSERAASTASTSGHRSRWRDMRPLEFVNTLVAVGTLIVAVVALIIASDTRDIKSAVSNLGVLAQQTSRQAKALEDQFGQIKHQTRDIGAEAQAL